MKISTDIAQSIVMEIGNIIHQNINLMDEYGTIIASTDLSRIGSFHQCAKEIIDKKLEELYVESEDKNSMMRTGLNLPLTYENEIIGVVGITGKYDQVKEYGQVVKKMTEILVREQVEENARHLQRRILSRFLEEWVLGESHANDEECYNKGMALGINIHHKRRVVVISPQDVQRFTQTLEGHKLLENIEKLASETFPRDIILRYADHQILLLRHQSDSSVQNELGKFFSKVYHQFGITMIAGVDAEASDIHQAYLQAEKAWRSSRLSGKTVLFYDRLSLELIQNNLPEHIKKEYLLQLFRSYDSETVKEWMELLEAYFEAEGSIQKTAALLYIHKNTVQYKILRLKDETGYDVRKPFEATILYMALIFYREFVR